MATNEVLQALRLKQEQEGLSLRQLASELDVSQPALTMLFHGRRHVTDRMARRIALYLRPKPTKTLREAVESFIRRETHRSLRTRESARERLEPFLSFLARHDIQSPSEITREQIDDFLVEIVAGRRGKSLSASSVYSFGKDIKAFINYIADTIAPEDWRNPVRKLRLVQPTTNIRPLSQTQVEALFSVAESYAPTLLHKARSKAMLYVLLDGALRISELLSATHYQLSEDGILRVMGKGGKEREVALSEQTLNVLAEYRQLRTDSSPYLIVTEDGNPLSYDGVKSLFHRWRKAAPAAFLGVRLSPHTLRHTSATMRRIAGMSEGDLQTFLGHSTPAMTRHYSAWALARSATDSARQTSPVDTLRDDNENSR